MKALYPCDGKGCKTMIKYGRYCERHEALIRREQAKRRHKTLWQRLIHGG